MNIKIHNPNNLPTIDYREVEEFQGNLKDLTKDNYAKLKKSIEENGFFIPMFLWKHKGKFKVLDAHQRLRVLKKENAQPYEIPYIEIEAKDEQEAKKKLLLISSQYGTITREGLDEFAFDLDDDWMTDTLNFDNIFDFDKITEIEEDDYNEPSKIETDIKLGDLFQLGDHRLLCGDATKTEDIELLMGEQKADMVFTDPPYGMNLDTDYSKMPRGGNKYGKVIGDNKDFDASFIFKIQARKYYIWGADYFYDTIPKGCSPIIWDKQPQTSEAGPQNHFEICWAFPKEKRRIIRHLWTGYTATEKNEKRIHPTQKPISVCIDIIQSQKANLIVDLYGGSGTTMIACEQLNRRCYMSEISPEYCQVIIDRFEKFTDKKAEKIN